jgi:thiamine phosphate synthase YjbQ (UPF0047 family)
MSTEPTDIRLTLQPESRVELIDVSERVKEKDEHFFDEYRKSAYASHHTTAGFFEQSFARRLKHDPEALEKYVGSFRKLFPPDADYRHDQMELRDELSEAQKLVEPKKCRFPPDLYRCRTRELRHVSQRTKVTSLLRGP